MLLGFDFGSLVQSLLPSDALLRTCLILIFMHKKCFCEKVKVYFGERLADCCGNKNVVTIFFVSC